MKHYNGVPLDGEDSVLVLQWCYHTLGTTLEALGRNVPFHVFPLVSPSYSGRPMKIQQMTSEVDTQSRQSTQRYVHTKLVTHSECRKKLDFWNLDDDIYVELTLTVTNAAVCNWRVLVDLGAIMVLWYTRVFRNLEIMIFSNTVKNIQVLLSLLN